MDNPSKMEWLSADFFAQLIALWQEEGRVPAELIARAEADRLPVALPMRALEAFGAGQWSRCLDLGLEFWRRQPRLPNRFIGMLADAAMRCDRKPDLSRPILCFAEQAVQEGKLDLALDAVKNIYSFTGDFAMIEESAAVQQVAKLLEEVAGHFRPQPVRSPASGKLRVAMVCVNLVDHVLAYSKRAMQFARYVDRERYAPFLYLCETTHAARPQEFSIRFEQPSSEVTGREYLAEMRRNDFPVRLAPPLPMTGLVQWLVGRMERDAIDAVVFQGGVNAVDMWLASRLSAVPVKVNLCLGINMYQPGMDAAIYDNQANLDREADFWNPAWGRQILLPGGVDMRETDAAPRPERAELSIPDAAVVFGVLSNYIDRRLTTEYLECVAQVMQACPQAWYLGMGAGDNSRPRQFLAERGLADRCRWLGQQTRPFSALKRLDFYYNEFPVGGCSVVREAIACGIPALAMHYSDKHHESAAAAIIGPPYALAIRDPAEYVTRAIAWVRDPALRARAAADLRQRARDCYSAAAFMHQLCDLLAELAEPKRRAAD